MLNVDLNPSFTTYLVYAWGNELIFFSLLICKVESQQYLKGTVSSRVVMKNQRDNSSKGLIKLLSKSKLYNQLLSIIAIAS